MSNFFHPSCIRRKFWNFLGSTPLPKIWSNYQTSDIFDGWGLTENLQALSLEYLCVSKFGNLLLHSYLRCVTWCLQLSLLATVFSFKHVWTLKVKRYLDIIKCFLQKHGLLFFIMKNKFNWLQRNALHQWFTEEDSRK